MSDEDFDRIVRRLMTESDRGRTIRLLWLERFADETAVFQREVMGLLQRVADAGHLPDGATIPTPPELPAMPKLDC